MAASFVVPLQDGTTYHDEESSFSGDNVTSPSDTGITATIAADNEPALPNAFVTMLTTSAYLPGALVLLHSLQELHPEPRDFCIVCLVTPETVDARTVGILRDAGYDLVIGVEPISSGASGQPGLRLMGRPDLDLALTKLHIFRLGHMFSSVIYLDADTLPLRPLSHLFKVAQEHTLSACPDSGWPDCFNSGVLVINPKLSDFDNMWQLLRRHASGEDGNGSFDGADQGLLNLYFSDEGEGKAWNRLPFTYNVTPSAAYQYAPAFKHYGRNINLIHFIGARKPWTRLANRPAGLQVSQDASSGYDYEHLIDRWYSVYDRYVRPTAAHEPNLAKRFAVPEHVAVWNRDGLAEQPGRLDLEALKAAAVRGVASLQTGQYSSLPLEGRIDLMMPKGETIPARQATSQHSTTTSQGSTTTSTSSSASPAPPAQHHQRHNDSGSAWDAAWQPPPPHGSPEMSVPMPAFYSAAWDEPPSSQAKYFQNHHDDATFPTLPANVQVNDWYGTFTSSTPNPAYERPPFPWEENARPEARRAFPKVNTPQPPKPTSQPATSKSGVHSKPNLTIAVQNSSAAATAAVPESSPAQLSFSEAMSTYTNAWDNVASIERYAKRLTKLGVATERRPQDGLQTVPPSPKRAHQHRQERLPLPRGNTESGSDGSADGDDEGEADESRSRRPQGEEASPYKTHAGYRDKTSQTDWPRSNDAVVQATAKYSDASSQSTLSSEGRPATTSNIYRRSNPSQPTVRPAPAVKTAGRVWDPKTDIEARKRDSHNVLSRFMQM